MPLSDKTSGRKESAFHDLRMKNRWVPRKARVNTFSWRQLHSRFSKQPGSSLSLLGQDKEKVMAQLQMLRRAQLQDRSHCE